MKGPVVLRHRDTPEGAFLEVQVVFTALWPTKAAGLLHRLSEVALALASGEGVRRYVTEIKTDIRDWCVVVTALVPTCLTAEQVQADLLAAVPPPAAPEKVQ